MLIFKKINALIKEIKREPFKGLGEPEPTGQAIGQEE